MISSTTRRNQPRPYRSFLAVGVILLFAAGGARILTLSHAATSTISIEPENGTITTAQTLNDTTASNGEAVLFAAATSNAVNCPLNAAAAGCWEAATGVHHGTGYTEAQILAGQSNLTKHTGNLSITTNGTVIDHMWIEGCIAVSANNVTIKNSLIHTTNGCQGGNQSAAPSLINDGTGGTTGLQIIDTEIDAMNATYDLSGGPHNNYTCLRCNIHGSAHNLWADTNVTIQDSYLHDLTTSDNAGHLEAVDLDSASGPVVIRHNWMNSRNSGAVTGALALNTTWGGITKVTIDQNYLEGGAGADIAIGSPSTYIVITNNALSPNNGYGGTQFMYGFNASGIGNIWSNNYNSETLAAIQP